MPLFRGSKDATTAAGDIVATQADIVDALNQATAARLRLILRLTLRFVDYSLPQVICLTTLLQVSSLLLRHLTTQTLT